MSGRSKRSATPPSAGLRPATSHDSVGEFIIVTCGSLSGNLYLAKLDASNKSQSKCIICSGKWYSPLEFESLAGKKARKWKQSLHHQGKPLSLYAFISSQGSSQVGQSALSASSVNTDGSCSQLVTNLALT